MKSTNQFLRNAWRQINRLFTAPTAKPSQHEADISRSFRQYSMPQYDQPEGHIRDSHRIRELKGLADQAGKYPYDVDVRAIVSALNDRSEEVRQTQPDAYLAP